MRLWLVALVVVAAIAVAPAAGAPGQSPKRGGTLVFAWSARSRSVSQRSAHRARGRDQPPWIDEGSARGPFDVGPDFTYEESLVSKVDFTSEAAVHTDLPHPPRGALERRSPGHGAGLHLHAPGDTPSRYSRSSVNSTPPSGVRVPSIARPCEWCFGRGSRAGGSSSANILPPHALRGADLTQVWGDRIDDPRTGRPIGSGPFLVERLERGRAARAPPQPPLLGTAPSLLSSGSSSDSRGVGNRSQRGADGAASSTSRWAFRSRCPGRSAAAGGAGIGFAGHRDHQCRAARRSARAGRSPGAPQQARSPRARVRDRPRRARPSRYGARSIAPLARSTAPCT